MHRSGHIGDFVISQEEAIAKGIRRIVALTGPEAKKALKKCEALEAHVKLINPDGNSAETSKKIAELNEEVSQATIPYWKKDELRTTLKVLKKQVDDR